MWIKVHQKIDTIKSLTGLLHYTDEQINQSFMFFLVGICIWKHSLGRFWKKNII